MKDNKRTTHESYAVAQLSRVSSSKTKPLFGSSIGHSNTIELRIYKAMHIRSDYSSDRYHPTDELIVVEMSNTQFAELITSFNYGAGVPVTLRKFDGDVIKQPDTIKDKRKEHIDEFKEKMREFSNRLKEGEERLLELLKKQKLSKDDKQEMKSLFNHMRGNINNNIPFFETMFEEQIDKTIAEAKGEIDSFITNAVTKTGLETLKKEGKMLNI
jgi:hypothetical protein